MSPGADGRDPDHGRYADLGPVASPASLAHRRDTPGVLGPREHGRARHQVLDGSEARGAEVARAARVSHRRRRAALGRWQSTGRRPRPQRMRRG